MWFNRLPKDFNSKFAEFKPIIAENKELIAKCGIDEVIMRHFEKTQGYRFDLNNPVTFNEKLAVRKKDNNPLFPLCADKIAVRKYVAEKIGEEYLVPIYYTGKHLTKSAWEKLPEEFVAKTNNGSGTIDVIRSKSSVQYVDLRNELEDWLGVKFGYIDGELFYNEIPPRILIEKLLLDENGQVPSDYKIHCFKNGGNRKKIIQIDYDRFSNHTRSIYDEKYNKLDVIFGYPQGLVEEKKPTNWDKMIELADVLSGDFDYVRVDFYDVLGKVYFGELTFCHEGAGKKIEPRSFDELLGSYWK